MAHKKGFYEKYIKRPQDMLCAGAAILVLSPVMAVTAVLVRVKLGSPVLFRQVRPGRDGEFLPDEERLPLFGQKLRSTSLDELPELFNILKGDMSVVGPRPLLMRYLPRYNARQARRNEVRPGFTGLAQVNGRNAITWEEKFEWDVRYVDSVSFLGDWSIILQTVKTVLSHEGISSGTSVTMEEFMGTPEPEKTD